MRGVTLIEILLVIAITAILGALTSPFLSNFLLRSNTDTAIDLVLGTLRKAQEYAMANKDNAVWGSCSVDNKIRLFKGTCTTPTWSEDYSIPGSVTVTGLTATTFNSRGEPSASLNISVQSSLKTVSIQLNSMGGLNVN